MVGTGIVTGFIPYALYSLALQNTESGVAIILSSVDLVVSAVLGYLVFQENLSIAKILGIFLVSTAIILLNVRSGRSKTVITNM